MREPHAAGVEVAGVPGPPEIAFHRHAVEVVDRPEGYREFRCLPATWSYPGPRPVASLLTEFYSGQMGVDPQGIEGDPHFWSGSDAALRLRAVPAEDLAVRELTALASRRSVGLNAPKPWVSQPEVGPLARAWEPEATGVHWTQQPVEEEPEDGSIWAHYGMVEGPVLTTVTGYYMARHERPPPSGAARPWNGGPGTWYAWSTLLGWDRWPRRQEAQPSSTAPVPGRLLLFVSHRWGSLDHPDGDGSQLRCLKVGLTLALAAAVLPAPDEDARATDSGLPEVLREFLDDAAGPGGLDDPPLQAWAARVRAAAEGAATEEDFWPEAVALETAEVRPALARIRDAVLVWYDYASMFQAPRTPAEEEAFRQEIRELNRIQHGAATVVIAGDEQYLSRAWCFLELCGGMRRRIVELTPSWGRSIGASGSATRWASRSDQLIGALNLLGLEAIRHSSLQATYPEDLADVAGLLSRLPLIGLIESDDSDLIGGALPMPLRDGAWVVPARAAEEQQTREYQVDPVADYGAVPSDAIQRAAAGCAGAASLGGEVGIWVYTTQQALTLAWASRAGELRDRLRPALAGLVSSSAEASVACMWADARALADDGEGWTRTIPTTVRLLVIVTQSGMAAICRIYERVLRAHLASGVPVLTFTPETGRALLHLPDEAALSPPDSLRADVLAVPRIRRSNAYGRQLLLPPSSSAEDLEVLAALRLDPAEGFVPPGLLSQEAAMTGLGAPGSEVTPARLLSFSEQRVRAEALARGTAATWDTWCAPRLHQGAWPVGMGALQAELIEQLVRKAFTVSDNPFRRSKLLDIIVEGEAGYALPPSILEDADELIRLIREREGAGQG